MGGYVFNPRRLRGSAKQQEEAGYAVAGRLLREHLGGAPLAELRRRVRSDARFHELLDELKVASARANEALSAELKRREMELSSL
jgi:hypothetical protein